MFRGSRQDASPARPAAETGYNSAVIATAPMTVAPAAPSAAAAAETVAPVVTTSSITTTSRPATATRPPGRTSKAAPAWRIRSSRPSSFCARAPRLRSTGALIHGRSATRRHAWSNPRSRLPRRLAGTGTRRTCRPGCSVRSAGTMSSSASSAASRLRPCRLYASTTAGTIPRYSLPARQGAEAVVPFRPTVSSARTRAAAPSDERQSSHSGTESVRHAIVRSHTAQLSVAHRKGHAAALIDLSTSPSRAALARSAVVQ